MPEERNQELLPLNGLAPSHVFGRIRDYLAGRHVGATRDAALLDQVVVCLFAKLYMTQHGLTPAPAVAVRTTYEQALRELRDILGSGCVPQSRLRFDQETLIFVDRALSLLDLGTNSSDLVGDAYQCFRGAEARGQEGQFFTPPAAINTLLSLVAPKPGDRVIDPACGAGGFLVAVAQHFRHHGASPADIARSIFGVDKDEYLVRLARMRVSLMTLRPVQIEIGDSLAWAPVSTGSKSFIERRRLGSFDIVLTNPPFGTKIIAASDVVRRDFALAYRWTPNAAGQLIRTSELLPSSPPQVLFLERCLTLVRPGGKIGMVIPESLVSGKAYRHVVEYISASAEIDAVIGMPEELFKTSGRGGTHTKTALVLLKKRARPPRRAPSHGIFMAEAEWCGHDSRGRPIPRNDTSTIVTNYGLWRTAKPFTSSALGFVLPISEIKNMVLAPRAYDPEISKALAKLTETHYLLKFGDFVKDGVLAVSTGDEVGKLAYGSKEIPFVRTSDLANWEIKIDPKQRVSREIFETLRRKQDVQPGDILMVKDGTYLIGTCAMVTKYDTEIVFQSHLYKIRVFPTATLDANILLAVLSSPFVQRQIRAEIQTQDIIESLGNRINNLILPIPRDETRRAEISQIVDRIITERAAARELVRRLTERILSPRTD